MKKLSFLLLFFFALLFLSGCDNSLFGSQESQVGDQNVSSDWVAVDYETELTQRILSVLDSVSVASDLPFSEPEPTMFTWYVETTDGYEELDVDGYRIYLEDYEGDLTVVDRVFENLWWSVSMSNLADGMTASMWGYYKDELWCQVFWELQATEEELFADDFDLDVIIPSNLEVMCGSVAVG